MTANRLTVRRAIESDDAVLLRIDQTSWDATSGFPSYQENSRDSFFARSGPDTHLVAELSLHVHGTNTVARRLYERHGYVVEGIHPNEFLIEGTYIDAIDMAKTL